MLALFVIGAFGGIAAWGVVAALRAERLTEAQRLIAAVDLARDGTARHVGDLRLARVLGLVVTAP